MIYVDVNYETSEFINSTLFANPNGFRRFSFSCAFGRRCTASACHCHESILESSASRVLSGAQSREISSGGQELHFDPEFKKRDGNSPLLRDCVPTFSVGEIDSLRSFLGRV